MLYLGNCTQGPSFINIACKHIYVEIVFRRRYGWLSVRLFLTKHMLLLISFIYTLVHLHTHHWRIPILQRVRKCLTLFYAMLINEGQEFLLLALTVDCGQKQNTE